MPLLLFDIDGTVTDTKAIDDACFLKAFENAFEINVKFKDWASYKHVTDSAIFKELYQNTFSAIANEEHKSQFISSFNSLLNAERIAQPTAFKEIPGAVNFIQTVISKKEFPIAFATGANKISAKMKLNEVGIEMDNFPNASSDDSDSREEIMLKAIERASTHYGENSFDPAISSVIYFGDGEWDFHATKNLGMPFIGVDVNSSGKLEKLGTRNIIRDYSKSEKVLEMIKLLLK